MHLTEPQKNLLGDKLAQRLAKAIEQKEIVVEEISDACDWMLSALDAMQTMEDYKEFLIKLADAWPFFTDLVDQEEDLALQADSVQEMFEDRNNVQLVGTSSH
jgi:hypothetical protein